MLLNPLLTVGTPLARVGGIAGATPPSADGSHYDVRSKQFQGHMHESHMHRQQRIVPSTMPPIKQPGGTEELHAL